MTTLQKALLTLDQALFGLVVQSIRIDAPLRGCEEVSLQGCPTVMHHIVQKGAWDLAIWLLGHCKWLHVQDNTGMTILHLAVQAGHTPFVNAIIERERALSIESFAGFTPSMNVRDHNNQTALMSALQLGHCEIACCLINNGAECSDATMPHQRTALHLAARNGRTLPFYCAARKYPYLLSHVDALQDTPLSIAISSANIQLISAAFSAAAEAGVDIDRCTLPYGDQMLRPLSYALLQPTPNVEVLQTILKNTRAPTPPDAPAAPPCSVNEGECLPEAECSTTTSIASTILRSVAPSRPMLTQSAAPSNIFASFLRDGPAILSASTKPSNAAPSASCVQAWAPILESNMALTELHAAASLGNVWLLEQVHERFPLLDVDVLNRAKDTPLSIAVRNAWVSGVRWFVQHGADVRAPHPVTGTTPLHTCVNTPAGEVLPALLEVCAYLVTHKADVNAVDTEHNTPLMMAVATRNPILASYLLEHGADPNAGASAGLLHEMISHGMWEPLKLACRTSRHINEVVDACTPLEYLCLRPGSPVDVLLAMLSARATVVGRGILPIHSESCLEGCGGEANNNMYASLDLVFNCERLSEVLFGILALREKACREQPGVDVSLCVPLSVPLTVRRMKSTSHVVGPQLRTIDTSASPLLVHASHPHRAHHRGGQTPMAVSVLAVGAMSPVLSTRSLSRGSSLSHARDSTYARTLRDRVGTRHRDDDDEVEIWNMPLHNLNARDGLDRCNRLSAMLSGESSPTRSVLRRDRDFRSPLSQQRTLSALGDRPRPHSFAAGSELSCFQSQDVHHIARMLSEAVAAAQGQSQEQSLYEMDMTFEEMRCAMTRSLVIRDSAPTPDGVAMGLQYEEAKATLISPTLSPFHTTDTTTTSVLAQNARPYSLSSAPAPDPAAPGSGYSHPLTLQLANAAPSDHLLTTRALPEMGEQIRNQLTGLQSTYTAGAATGHPPRDPVFLDAYASARNALAQAQGIDNNAPLPLLAGGVSSGSVPLGIACVEKERESVRQRLVQREKTLAEKDSSEFSEQPLPALYAIHRPTLSEAPQSLPLYSMAESFGLHTHTQPLSSTCAIAVASMDTVEAADVDVIVSAGVQMTGMEAGPRTGAGVGAPHHIPDEIDGIPSSDALSHLPFHASSQTPRRPPSHAINLRDTDRVDPVDKLPPSSSISAAAMHAPNSSSAPPYSHAQVREGLSMPKAPESVWGAGKGCEGMLAAGKSNNGVWTLGRGCEDMPPPNSPLLAPRPGVLGSHTLSLAVSSKHSGDARGAPAFPTVTTEQGTPRLSASPGFVLFSSQSSLSPAFASPTSGPVSATATSTGTGISVAHPALTASNSRLRPQSNTSQLSFASAHLGVNATLPPSMTADSHFPAGMSTDTDRLHINGNTTRHGYDRGLYSHSVRGNCITPVPSLNHPSFSGKGFSVRGHSQTGLRDSVVSSFSPYLSSQPSPPSVAAQANGVAPCKDTSASRVFQSQLSQSSVLSMPNNISATAESRSRMPSSRSTMSPGAEPMALPPLLGSLKGKQDIRFVEALLQAGASLNERDPTTGRRAVQTAIACSSPEVVYLVLKIFVQRSPVLYTHCEEHPLDVARERGDVRITHVISKVLMEEGFILKYLEAEQQIAFLRRREAYEAKKKGCNHPL